MTSQVIKVGKAARRTSPRGQAMLEYSFITWLLAFLLVVGGSIKFPGMGKSVLDLFIESYNIYYDSFYFVLNLPFP